MSAVSPVTSLYNRDAQQELYERMKQSLKEQKDNKTRARKEARQLARQMREESELNAQRLQKITEEEDQLYRPIELKVLQFINKLPAELLPVAWNFMSADSKLAMNSGRFTQFCSKYLRIEDDGFWSRPILGDCRWTPSLSSNARLLELIAEIPHDILVRFMRFGTPVKLYSHSTYENSPTLYNKCMNSTHENAFQYELDLLVCGTFARAYAESHEPVLVALANSLMISILYVHRKFAIIHE